MCVYMLEPCVLLGLDWVEPMTQFSLHVTCSCIIHTYIPFSFSYLVLSVDGAFLFVSLSLSLLLSLSLSLSHIACTWHPSPKLLHPGTLFMFGSIMRRPVRTSRRTFPNVVFIRNTMWFYRIFSILFYPLSFTVRDRNLYVRYL